MLKVKIFSGDPDKVEVKINDWIDETKVEIKFVSQSQHSSHNVVVSIFYILKTKL